jgi:hypothetical protein
VFVLKDIHKFRQRDPRHLMSLVVHAGADHFHGAPELAEYAALFLRKTAQYRLPEKLPPGNAPVECLPVELDHGWLTDEDLYEPKHAPAPYADYSGDKTKAMWHFDQEIAQATVDMHRNLGNHQVLSNPVCTWLDQGDGWTFRAKAEFLDTMPEKYGGRVGGKRVGHAGTPFIYRAKINEPVRQVGPDTFRLLRPTRRVHVAAFHPGDEHYRATIRWGSIDFPRVKGAKQQTIAFAPLSDIPFDAKPLKLEARASSNLPVYYEVDYGPVVVEGDTLKVSEVPVRARFPIECRITAYQLGRRIAPAIEPAEPTSATFRVLAP